MTNIIVVANQRSKPQDKDTEAKILMAAEREFMAKGFAGARTTTIAEAAGVTHAMFHYYFRTKEKIFERIIAEKIALLKQVMLGSIEDASAPLNEIIRNIICRHLDFISANPDLPRFLVGEIFRNPERSYIFSQALKEHSPAFITFIQHKIDREADAGRCRKIDAKMLILDILSLNIFAYMAAPAINASLDNCMADSEAFLTRRKEENYDTIMRKLKL